jgi:cysteinyl-tRNA synthetase
MSFPALSLYNSLSRRKEIFTPLRAGEVRMYVCGMTIYDLCHIGHGRMLMAFDVIQRWLRTSGYKVTYVRNITDIDDKIIKRAVENGETIYALTERNIQLMNEDLEALGIQKPDHEPRATQYVPQMLSMIEKLQENKLAYQDKTGDVNFAVRRFKGYGKLSGKSLDELHSGQRVAVNEAKDDPLDFVLWKSAKPEEPAEAKWQSPWGEGRPGWAIECSAMGCALLGETFDIHGGGEDLTFPHHENEIAQSEGASGKPFVNYWLHNGFLNVNNEKMSKSLNNFFTLRDVLKSYDAEVVRFFLIRTHYRTQFNYADTLMDDAKRSLDGLYVPLRATKTEPDQDAPDWDEPYAQRFASAMNDDFNTPIAISVLFELAGQVNRTQSKELALQLMRLGGVLGILKENPEARSKKPRLSFTLTQNTAGSGITVSAVGASQSHSQAAAIGIAEWSSEWIDEQVEKRKLAKNAKNFAEADRIRKDLLDKGVLLEDKPGGHSEWRRA